MKNTVKNIRIMLALILVLMVASCATQRPAPREQILSKEVKSVLRIAELEKKIHELINRERTSRGLSSLEWNSALSAIARKHSMDMAKRNYFSHESPEGRGFSFRYSQEGYVCSVPVQNRFFLGAENIFQNNLYDRVVYVNGSARYNWNSSQKIAESTVEGWMNSPGHRKNILTPHWRSEGIGVAISPDDKVYITENFC